MENDDIRIIFVIPQECKHDSETSNEMQQAFSICHQHSINTEWVKEADVSKNLKKTDIVVFQKFKGEKFKEIKSSKSVRIVGPWCLLTCITEGKSIPNVPWPVYNVAMLNCIVTCSHLSKSQKQEIQEHVQQMGGYYTENLMENTTHLITDTVKSEKYIKAAESGLKIMLSPWVFEVWKASCKSNIVCDDKEFDKYRCPPFHNLVICCTGFTQLSQREQIEKLVTENGGTYRGQLLVNSTDILICEQGSTSSAKYKAAKKSQTIKCVSFEWLTASIEKGYALPDSMYPIKASTSTPTKEGANSLPDFSMISNIGSSSVMSNNTISETINICSSVPHTNGTKKRKSSSNDWDDLVDKIELTQVKNAGPFLDGCSIYLAGFSTEQKEKLCKVLNFGGAMRYDDISERITHVIVGDTSCHDLKIIHNKGLSNVFPLLNLQWLLDSIEQKHPVPEEKYVVNLDITNDNEPRSPLSKKGLFALRTNTPKVKQPSELSKNDNQQNEIEKEILQQYLQPESEQDTLALLLKNANNTFEPNANVTNQNKSERQEENKTSQELQEGDTASTVTEASSQALLIFENMKFIVSGFHDEEPLKSVIEALGGTVVPESYKGIPDYILVPQFLPSMKIKASSEVVTDLWLTECQQEKQALQPKYYHKPVFLSPDIKPLKNMVVTVSGYTNYERHFLRTLTEQLGGYYQEQFARVSCPKKNLVGSTHLVTYEPSGKKYEAAIKWNLPVVNKNWLLECAQAGKLVSEKGFLIGDAKVPERNQNTLEKMKSLSLNRTEDSVKSATPKRVKEINENNNKQKEESNMKTPPVKEVVDFTKTKNILTPVNKKNESPAGVVLCKETEILRTPINRERRISEICSQVTPVNKIMEEIRMTNLLGTPECPTTPKPWNHVTTPDTPLGAFIRPDPSPTLRKEIAQWINTLPDWKPPPPRRPSTPLSELKKQLWNKILPSRDTVNVPPQPNFQNDLEENSKEGEASVTPKKNNSPKSQETPENIFVRNQLQQIQAMLTSTFSGGKNNTKKRQSTVPETAPIGGDKDSQANTVGWGWDDSVDEDCQNFTESAPPPKIMLSGIPQDERDYMVEQLEALGAIVSDSANYDPNCTHLICPKPLRNEKILACMASGKWILHTSYVEECVKAGKLLKEDLFEYGNPQSMDNSKIPRDKDSEARMEAMHWWRKEITKRGYGPFHDMRAIVVAQKRDPITRVIEAGGGIVIDAKPPFNGPVHATHCLLEPRAVADFSYYIPLAEQGIYCINTVYISDFLQRTASDARNSVLPFFAKYYS